MDDATNQLTQEVVDQLKQSAGNVAAAELQNGMIVLIFTVMPVRFK